MKTTASRPLLVALAISLGTAVSVLAHDGKERDKGSAKSSTSQLTRVDEKTDVTWLAKARAAYPLSTCAVSGDKLEGGSMGLVQDFVLKAAGQPDRLVRFCCKDCEADFNKEPAKPLKVIDEAAAAKAKTGK